MKLEHLPEYVTIAVTVTLGMLLAVYLGTAVGSGSHTPFIIVGGFLAITVALVMQENIWLLIPLSWPLTGQIIGMPGSFPVRDLVMVYAFVVFLALKALKIVRAKTQYNWLDYLLWLNLFWLAIAYIRNPVGTKSMDIDRIGGKFYFEAVFITMGYWVLGHVTLSPKRAQIFPLFMVFGNLFNAVLGFITYHIPALVPLVGRFYTGISSSAYQDTISTSGERVVAREEYLGGAGSAVLRTIYSWYSPISTFNPLRVWRFLFSILAIFGILKSGFRSSLFGSAVLFSIICYYRDGRASLFRAFTVLAALLAFLILMQGTLIELPLPVQRTLSFLPGQWDARAVEDAVGSTEWRHEIWARVWNSGTKYIHNWWLGDGFGMSRQEHLNAMNSAFISNENNTESLILTGNYHSGPLTTIHIVGYVGLVFLSVMLFGIAFYGWQLILRAKGTPYFPMALFMGAQAIFEPLPFLILTGFYDLQLVGSIFSIGIMRMVVRSLDQYTLSLDEARQVKPVPEFNFASPLPEPRGQAKLPALRRRMIK